MEAIDLSNLKFFRGKLVDYRRKSPTANGSVMFNDMLGTTQGTFSDGKYSKNNVTLFGETDNKETMFTGKPQIDGIGYSFLFRSYRPELAKWTPNFGRNFEFVRSESEAEQTSDPFGYPDGFNNFAYVNNGVTSSIDWLGCSTSTLPALPADVTSSTTWNTGENNSAYGYYTVTSYDWSGPITVSGQGKVDNFSAGIVNISAITKAQIKSFSSTVSSSIESEITSELGVDGGKIGSSIKTSMTTSLTATAGTSVSTTSSIAIQTNYPIDIPKDSVGYIYVYQKITYHSVLIPQSVGGNPSPPTQYNVLDSIIVPTQDVHYAHEIVE